MLPEAPSGRVGATPGDGDGDGDRDCDAEAVVPIEVTPCARLTTGPERTAASETPVVTRSCSG